MATSFLLSLSSRSFASLSLSFSHRVSFSSSSRLLSGVSWTIQERERVKREESFFGLVERRGGIRKNLEMKERRIDFGEGQVRGRRKQERITIIERRGERERGVRERVEREEKRRERREREGMMMMREMVCSQNLLRWKGRKGATEIRSGDLLELKGEPFLVASTFLSRKGKTNAFVQVFFFLFFFFFFLFFFFILFYFFFSFSFLFLFFFYSFSFCFYFIFIKSLFFFLELKKALKQLEMKHLFRKSKSNARLKTDEVVTFYEVEATPCVLQFVFLSLFFFSFFSFFPFLLFSFLFFLLIPYFFVFFFFSKRVQRNCKREKETAFISFRTSRRHWDN